MEQTEDVDLKALFSTFSVQSKANNAELRSMVPASEKAPERDETRLSGKFYRVWMDVKNALVSNNRKEVLSSCEYGEDVAKKAYEDVLADRSELSSAVVAQIQKQYDELLQAHNQVKSLRDSA